MLFNSYIFILLFLPLTVFGYYLLNKKCGNTLSKIWLLTASLFFYGYFNWSYLTIIVLSIIINYILTLLMRKTDKASVRKLLLAVGLLLNIGCIFYYKYYDFFISNINICFKTSFTLTHLVLPLGISFFTFQQLSFVIDSYRRKTDNYSFLDYALFVTFFPQLIAGPIVLHSEIIPQFADRKNQYFNYENFGKGLYAFAIGLFKKVLLADTFGKIANWGFGDINSLGTVNAIIVMLSYTLQIYLDFSGYSDMAIGLGYMFNIKLPVNFNSPYKAVTVVDFWKRWHITLTRFFTTYIYIPLGGSKVNKPRTLVNIMIVFLVSGIWHGANWTFIVWGLFHGFAQVICRVFSFKSSENKLKNALLWVITFIFINLTWVVFRAESLGDAINFFNQLAVFKGFNISNEIINAFQFREFELVLGSIPFIGQRLLSLVTFFAFATSFVCILVCRNTKEIVQKFNQPKWYNAVFCVIMLVWSVLSFSGVSTFLYWNF